MSSFADFLETFADRRRCFADLLELSQRQLALVECDDYSQLLGLLGGKHQLIGRLEAIGRRRPHLWDEWRRERDHMPPPLRHACEAALAESEAILSRLLDCERTSTESLARRRDNTAQQLRSVATGSRVNQAY